MRDAAPEEVRANISTGFAAVVARGMQKRVENRFATADEMATALYGCLVRILIYYIYIYIYNDISISISIYMMMVCIHT